MLKKIETRKLKQLNNFIFIISCLGILICCIVLGLTEGNKVATFILLLAFGGYFFSLYLTDKEDREKYGERMKAILELFFKNGRKVRYKYDKGVMKGRRKNISQIVLYYAQFKGIVEYKASFKDKKIIVKIYLNDGVEAKTIVFNENEYEIFFDNFEIID